MSAAETLRRLADWCEAHGVSRVIGIALYTNQPQIHLHAEDFARLAPGAPARTHVSSGGATNQPEAEVDGQSIVTCIFLPAPPSPANVSPDAAEGVVP